MFVWNFSCEWWEISVADILHCAHNYLSLHTMMIPSSYNLLRFLTNTSLLYGIIVIAIYRNYICIIDYGIIFCSVWWKVVSWIPFYKINQFLFILFQTPTTIFSLYIKVCQKLQEYFKNKNQGSKYFEGHFYRGVDYWERERVISSLVNLSSESDSIFFFVG